MWINDSFASGAHQSSTESRAENWGTICSVCRGLIHGPLDLSYMAVLGTVPSMLLAVRIGEYRCLKSQEQCWEVATQQCVFRA